MPWKTEEKRKAYAKKHRQKMRDNLQKWRKDNPDKIQAQRVKYHAEHPEQILLSRARSRAKKKKIECSIVEGDIIIPNVCPLLGIPLHKVGLNGKALDTSPSLDRIDSTKGYVKGNVWVISWRANSLKNDATLDELEKLVSALRQKLKEE